MGQEDILKILELDLKKTIAILKLIEEKDIKEEILWANAAKKEDIALMIGIGVDSVTRSISKLILHNKIVSITHQKDKRKRKYILKDEHINNMVCNGSTKL